VPSKADPVLAEQQGACSLEMQQRKQELRQVDLAANAGAGTSGNGTPPVRSTSLHRDRLRPAIMRGIT
jgi:hypothetical protein